MPEIFGRVLVRIEDAENYDDVLLYFKHDNKGEPFLSHFVARVC